MIADGGWELSQEVENDLREGERRGGETMMRGGCDEECEWGNGAICEQRRRGGGGDTRQLLTTREQSWTFRRWGVRKGSGRKERLF